MTTIVTDLAIAFALGRFPHLARLALDGFVLLAVSAVLAAAVVSFYAVSTVAGRVVAKTFEPLYRRLYIGHHRPHDQGSRS